MALNRRHMRRKPLPEMMPPSVIDALVAAAGRRVTPLPVEPPFIVTHNPTPLAHYEMFVKLHAPVVTMLEVSQLADDHVADIIRRRDKMVEMVMQGYATRTIKDTALHAFKYGTGAANFAKHCKKESE